MAFEAQELQVKKWLQKSRHENITKVERYRRDVWPKVGGEAGVSAERTVSGMARVVDSQWRSVVCWQYAVASCKQGAMQCIVGYCACKSSAARSDGRVEEAVGVVYKQAKCW